jgi:hypothetical protein
MSKYSLRAFSFLVLVLVVGSIACDSSTVVARRTASRARRQAANATPSPSELTDTARLLAGLPPDPTGPLAAVAAKPEWTAWRSEVDAHWTRLSTGHFDKMAQWRDRELAPLTGNCGTLMYPFSGPDILNALVLFPDCKRFILFGLEPVGSLPSLDALPPERLARLLDETRKALNDLLERNYFITSHMMQDTAAQELKGTLPLIALSLVRLDARLIGVREMEIAEDGTLRPRTPPVKDRRVASAIEIRFERPDHDPQSLVYFRAQAEDRALPNRPGVMPFLEQQAPFLTFLKSASYLLHTSDFKVMRAMLLDHSRLVLEDDSGIPLRYLKAPDWTVNFYGKYTTPVKDFDYGYQADMAKVYAAPNAVKPLAFSFGYHWRDGFTSVLLAVRHSASSTN